jgi:hypothetical protein
MSHNGQNRGKYKQLSLFPQKLCSAHLVAADSPRSAFYRIWIADYNGVYLLVKESGIKGIIGRVLDKRSWPFESFEEAEKVFNQRIKEKTDPERKSPRKYKLIHHNKTG